MAKKESTPDLPLPSEGGSYIRDDQTGALTRADQQETTQPAAPVAASEKE
jgi:hypothetical protein